MIISQTRLMDLKRWCNSYYIQFLLLFCSSGIVLSLNMCMPGLELPGYTVPHGDIIIEYGDPLDIMCVLVNITNKKLSSNAGLSLSFKRNFVPVPSEIVDVVNSTVITLHIDRPPKTSRIVYSCYMNNDFVCSNFVTVGTKPQAVTDFKCIGYNYDNLTCTWTPPQNYVKTDYTLLLTFTGRRIRSTSSCPSLIGPDTNNHMSCFWSVSTSPPYRQVHENYNFTLEMRNTFGTNTLNTLFDHFAHVLSEPPENLTVISTTSSSIYLYWMVPLQMQTFPPGVHHRILYQCLYGESKWQFGALITTKTHNKYMKYNLTNLKYAHDLCDVRVSLRSAKALIDDESMWSRNASITVRTSSKAPDEPPETNVGSFEIVTFSNSLQHREAYIYWKQTSEEQKNGPDFRYRISVEGNPSIQLVEFTSTYAKYENLLISTSYKFNIWSENADGSTVLKSTVYVPKETNRIKEPSRFTKVNLGNGRYQLTWKVPQLPPNRYLTNYTIFSCSNERGSPYQCNDMLNWTVVANYTTTTNITVDKNKLFQFAISANTHDSSSGMLWAVDTIRHNIDVNKLKNVWINRVGSTFITVGWELDGIDSVEGYVVYYCPIKPLKHTECTASPSHRTFNEPSVAGGTITNLNPYTTYKLTVSRNTPLTQQSDPLYTTTLDAEILI